MNCGVTANVFDVVRRHFDRDTLSLKTPRRFALKFDVTISVTFVSRTRGVCIGDLVVLASWSHSTNSEVSKKSSRLFASGFWDLIHGQFCNKASLIVIMATYAPIKMSWPWYDLVTPPTAYQQANWLLLAQ